MLNVRRLCVVVDCLISAAKVCDSVISAWCCRYVVAWWSYFAKILCASNKNVSLEFRFADYALEKLLSIQENWI